MKEISLYIYQQFRGRIMTLSLILLILSQVSIVIILHTALAFMGAN